MFGLFAWSSGLHVRLTKRIDDALKREREEGGRERKDVLEKTGDFHYSCFCFVLVFVLV